MSLNICLEAINSKSWSHVFVPDKMLELEVDTKRLNYNDNSKFMPFGTSFIFMRFGNYAIWEVTLFMTEADFYKAFWNFFLISLFRDNFWRFIACVCKVQLCLCLNFFNT